MPRSGSRRPAERLGYPTRDAIVGAQYDSVDAATGYATSHEGWGPPARYFHSRLHVVDEALRQSPGGDLLDIGCGPGILLRHLLDTRAGDFRLTGGDRSRTMVKVAGERVADETDARVTEARIESMPLPDASFDVAIAMGVLEYSDVPRGLSETARVVRPGGLVLVTMLNPRSPYRLFEWIVYWPALRLLGRVERLLRVAPERRHGARVSGIRAIPAARLCRKMRDVGLVPHDVVYYDLTPLVPPLDRIARRWARRWRAHPETTVSRGRRRWMGTAYLVAARRIQRRT
ncbi:MAG: methyltransferase domain-containing protein [Streptosporangiales bacterium]|nr:methyltransferase domain-containing protein [Streptosporangiales bacterium]